MKLDRRDIVEAAEIADMSEDDYEIREAYSGRWMDGGTCAAVTLLNSGKLTEFMVALAVQLTENGQADDAMSLARMTRTDSEGFGIVAYWPGVEIAA